MPIIEEPTSVPQPHPGQLVPTARIADEDYRHSVVDAKENPLSSLLVYIAGSNWFVDYYSQQVGADEELSPFQPAQQAVYQQYLLVKGFILKLQDSLSPSIDPETQIATVTGSATIFPYLKPNKGDAFVADIGDGRAGQFTITDVQKKTILKETCYEVSFVLARFMTQDLDTLINTRVVKTVYFQRDYLAYGQNPMLTSEGVENRKTLETLEADLFKHWSDQFYSREYRTFLVPGQVEPTYDPYVTNAVLRLYDTREYPNLYKARQLNVQGVPLLEQPDFYTALLAVDKNQLRDVFATTQGISVVEWAPQPAIDCVRYSGIRTVVAPKALGTSVDKDYGHAQPITGIPLIALNDWAVDLASVLFNNVLSGLYLDDGDQLPIDQAFLSDEVPLVHPILLDDGYVLSSFFYSDNTEGMSKLELMIHHYFEHREVPIPILVTFCGTIRTWGRLERYYYIPILLAMLKMTQRSL